MRTMADYRQAKLVMLRAFGGGTGHYDAAQTGVDFAEHFATANGGSSDAHANPEARKILRERMRYEFANSPYLRGIADTQTNKICGRRPKIRIQDREVPRALTRGVEQKIAKWIKATKFGAQLRLIYNARLESGEIFLLPATNQKIRNAVKFYWKDVECDQCQSDPERYDEDDEKYVDGVYLDADGNPIRYTFLRRHPGSLTGMALTSDDYMEVPAENVVHFFKKRRPGQHRGVPELSPSLVPVAALRRYTNATVKAAETAASITFLMETDEIGEDAEEGLPAFDLTQIKHDMGMALPDGWKGKQLKAEQPVAEYPAFKKEMVGEAGRSIGQPKNRAAADSQDASFSSARLDHLDHNDPIRIDRDELDNEVIYPTLIRWAQEAILHDEAFTPEEIEYLNDWLNTDEGFPPYTVYWDGQDSFDRDKDAKANDTDLRNGSRSLTEILEQRGISMEDHFDNLAAEQEYAAEVGVTPGYMILAPGAVDPNNPQTTENQEQPNGQSQEQEPVGSGSGADGGSADRSNGADGRESESD